MKFMTRKCDADSSRALGNKCDDDWRARRVAAAAAASALLDRRALGILRADTCLYVNTSYSTHSSDVPLSLSASDRRTVCRQEEFKNLNHTGRSDVADSMVTIRSPFCRYNTI